MSAPEKNYKDTILLPKTGFPMRGDLTKNEPVRLKKWEDTGLYERILSRRIEPVSYTHLTLPTKLEV